MSELKRETIRSELERSLSNRAMKLFENCEVKEEDGFIRTQRLDEHYFDYKPSKRIIWYYPN